jgi:tetratricopeptide (TPR) repeat protein
MEAKHIRTTTLLKEIISADDEDAYSIYQLSSSYSMHREFDKAVDYGKMALNLMHRKRLKNGFFLDLFHTVAHGYYALGQVIEAERTCREALDFFPMHLDICHLLADIYFHRQSPVQYREIAERYLSIYAEVEKNPAILGGFFCHSYTRRNEIYFGLACINFLEKDFAAADSFFRKSFEDSGEKMEKAKTICRFYFEQKMYEKSLEWMNMACEPGLRESNISDADLGKTAYALAEAFCRRRMWHPAESALKTAIRIAPAGFDHNKFDRLLRGAEQIVSQSS